MLEAFASLFGRLSRPGDFRLTSRYTACEERQDRPAGAYGGSHCSPTNVELTLTTLAAPGSALSGQSGFAAAHRCMRTCALSDHEESHDYRDWSSRPRLVQIHEEGNALILG